MDSVVGAIFGVFSEIGDWIVSTIPTFFDLFYTTEGGLTLLGSLAIIGLGLGVVYGLFRLVRSFIK